MEHAVETPDWQLLRRYVEEGSEAAFRQLVERHQRLVYSACLRELADPELAEDVTQVVFLVLAQKARRLRAGTVLAGWLFNTARFASRNALRQERRRAARERQVVESMEAPTGETLDSRWQGVEPLLQDALAALGEKDRNAILLRFFEERSLRETGAALGLSENAAQMRVSRALEKLRRHLGKHGVVVPAALGGLLSARAVQAVPPSLGYLPPHPNRVPDGVSEASSLYPSRVDDLTKGVLHAMQMIQIRTAAAVVTLSFLTAGGLAVGARALDRVKPPVPAAAGPANKIVPQQITVPDLNLTLMWSGAPLRLPEPVLLTPEIRASAAYRDWLRTGKPGLRTFPLASGKKLQAYLGSYTDPQGVEREMLAKLSLLRKDGTRAAETVCTARGLEYWTTYAPDGKTKQLHVMMKDVEPPTRPYVGLVYRYNSDGTARSLQANRLGRVFVEDELDRNERFVRKLNGSAALDETAAR